MFKAKATEFLVKFERRPSHIKGT